MGDINIKNEEYYQGAVVICEQYNFNEFPNIAFKPFST